MSCHHKGQPTIPPCLLPAITRRRFLERAGAAAALTLALPACEFAESFEPAVSTEGAEPAPFDVMQQALAPLQTVGGGAFFDAPLPGGTSLALVLVRVSETEVYAFDQICPHAGLQIDFNAAADVVKSSWDASKQELRCGWHGSLFTATGEPANAVPPTGINRYATTFDATTGAGEVDVTMIVM